MKKSIISMLFAFAVYASALAQDVSEHLTFKGVPIDGTLSEYVAKMKKAGFTYVTTQDGDALLQGEFAGYKECSIFINTLKATDKVCSVIVLFSPKESWMLLENNYSNLKSMLTEKYGEPSDCVETFQGYTTPQTDRDKLLSLQSDACTWYTTFTTAKGDVRLTLMHTGDLGCFVGLRYLDRINSDAARAKAMDDL